MDERTNELLHSKFEQVFGEPESTLVMSRLGSTEDFRLVKDEVVRLELRMDLLEERLRAEIQSGLRKHTTTTLAVMAAFNAVIFAVLGLVLA